MRQLLLLIPALGAGLAGLPACMATGEPDPAADDSASDEHWQAFKRSAVKIADDPVRYIYGGDMQAVGEDGLRRAYERYFGSPASRAEGEGTITSPLSVDRVNGVDQLLAKRSADSAGGRHEISYCIQRSTFTAAQLATLETALDLATQSWSDLVNIQFRHDASQDASCGAGNANVFYNIRNVSDGSFFGNAFFPEDPRAARELLIDDAAFTTTSGGRDLQGILRHEHGHILGFRHEHVWLGDCTIEGVDDARHVTAYDVDSVMHYPQCRPSGSGGYRQSTLDYQGAIELYGLSASLLAVL